MDLSFIFVFASIFVAGAVLFLLMSLTKRTSRIDVEKYRSKWLSIEQSLVRDNTSSHSVAILHADSLLDKALQEKGVSGKVMADRLKQTKWSNANALWSAHKLRNRVAHDNIQPDYQATRVALSAFKQALKDIGAI